MKKIISTDKAPAPIGPYNQAVMAGDTLYISGQIGLDPESGELQSRNIMAEAEQALNNMGAILQEAAMDWEQVVKVSIFLTDMGQFQAVNGIYASYFHEDTAPARETVEVTALPKGAKVEFSAIALNEAE